MKTMINKLAEIHEKGFSSFLVGIILFGDDDYIFIKNVSSNDVYDGYVLVPTKGIRRLVYSSRCVSFYSTVLNDDGIRYCFSNPKEMVRFCFENNKVIEVSVFKWNRYVEDLLILECHDSFFLGKRISRNGELQRTLKVYYDEISYLLFDSITLKNFEKLFYERGGKKTI